MTTPMPGDVWAKDGLSSIKNCTASSGAVPAGAVVVECAVTKKPSGKYAVTGLEGHSAADIAAAMGHEHYVASVPVVLKRLSVPTLPPVVVEGGADQ